MFASVNQANNLKDLINKGRAIVPIKVELMNEENTRALIAVFDWFVAKK